MTTADVLREARALFAANPSHAPEDEMPPCGSYCVMTALVQAPSDYSLAYEAFRRAAAVKPGSVAAWNAAHSTEDVLAAFDRAIALAEGSS